jgi:GrpB-like predicted nucleotidyltransferase (UPF0157 family)
MTNVYFKPTTDFTDKANKLFREQRAIISDLIPSAEIEHIGSTVIPGSITKGDLDMNIRVRKENFNHAIEVLRKLYEINQLRNWTENFASFKSKINGTDLGIQLTILGSPADDFVRLRDTLIKNPDLIKESNLMKQRHNGKDMDNYRKEKAKFFEKLKRVFNPNKKCSRKRVSQILFHFAEVIRRRVLSRFR